MNLCVRQLYPQRWKVLLAARQCSSRSPWHSRRLCYNRRMTISISWYSLWDSAWARCFGSIDRASCQRNHCWAHRAAWSSIVIWPTLMEWDLLINWVRHFHSPKVVMYLRARQKNKLDFSLVFEVDSEGLCGYSVTHQWSHRPDIYVFVLRKAVAAVFGMFVID